MGVVNLKSTRRSYVANATLSAIYNCLTPDLIVLDVMMPKLDGYGVCHEILQQLWGFVPEMNTDTRVVDVHISRKADKGRIRPQRPRIHYYSKR